jgi:hypothetical protein
MSRARVGSRKATRSPTPRNGKTDDDADRQRLFEIFNECAELAERRGDRALSTLALGIAMVAAEHRPRRSKRTSDA